MRLGQTVGGGLQVGPALKAPTGQQGQPREVSEWQNDNQDPNQDLLALLAALAAEANEAAHTEEMNKAKEDLAEETKKRENAEKDFANIPWQFNMALERAPGKFRTSI